MWVINQVEVNFLPQEPPVLQIYCDLINIYLHTQKYI